MVKKKEDMPKWVSDEIQSAKFEKPVSITSSGYILEIYDGDEKIDAQLYEPVEDGRHIVAMDLPKNIKSVELEKGVVYQFTFDSNKAPLNKKVIEYLQKEKEIEMSAIYQFKLKNLELVGDDSSESTDVEME
jgi:tRNA(Ile2) C34 agmatinyltransferase TiaS